MDGKDGVMTEKTGIYGAWVWNADNTIAKLIIIPGKKALEPYYISRNVIISLYALTLLIVLISQYYISCIYGTKLKDLETRYNALSNKNKILSGDLEKSNDRLLLVNKELNQLSTIDKKTALPNRKSFETFSELEWRHCNRLKLDLSIIIVDIDYFKEYNGLYGREKGDECLFLVAECFRNSSFLSRPGDLAARYGSDEFIVILGNSGIDSARKVCDIVNRNLETKHIPHPENRSNANRIVSLSMGIVTKKADDKASVRELIENAYIALYKSKKDGRNRVTAFTGQGESNEHSDSI
jgi:diguanylate cyclase (GGDEF)-like protein